MLITGLARTNRPHLIPGAVGVWAATAIFATSSTGFANPAVTLARSLTETYTGIAPVSLPGFVVGQVLGALLVVAANDLLFPIRPARTASREETLV